MATLRLASTSRLLDLAAGTGKLGRRFMGRVNLVTGEPSAEMRTEFARIQPDVPLVGTVGGALPVADAALDAVTIGPPRTNGSTITDDAHSARTSRDAASLNGAFGGRSDTLTSRTRGTPTDVRARIRDARRDVRGRARGSPCGAAS
jgi:hypothetical protein